MMLDRVRQEALKAGSSVEHLREELGKLRVDLERQEALVSQRGKGIAETRPTPNGAPGGLPSSTGLLELSQT